MPGRSGASRVLSSLQEDRWKEFHNRLECAEFERRGHLKSESLKALVCRIFCGCFYKCKMKEDHYSKALGDMTLSSTSLGGDVDGKEIQSTNDETKPFKTSGQSDPRWDETTSKSPQEEMMALIALQSASGHFVEHKIIELTHLMAKRGIQHCLSTPWTS